MYGEIENIEKLENIEGRVWKLGRGSVSGWEGSRLVISEFQAKRVLPLQLSIVC